MTGVIVREKLSVFERVLWRACRGNVFLRRAEIEEPLENPTTVSNTSMSFFSTQIIIIVETEVSVHQISVLLISLYFHC